jgi:hypothetical protein
VENLYTPALRQLVEQDVRKVDIVGINLSTSSKFILKEAQQQLYLKEWKMLGCK